MATVDSLRKKLLADSEAFQRDLALTLSDADREALDKIREKIMERMKRRERMKRASDDEPGTKEE